MSALDYLEKVALIPIFNKLAEHLLEMAVELHFDESTLDDLRIENNPVDGSRVMMKAWLSNKSSPPPTWQVLLEKLRIFGMGELAQEIEHFFSRMSVTSLSASLVSFMVMYTCVRFGAQFDLVSLSYRYLAAKRKILTYLKLRAKSSRPNQITEMWQFKCTVKPPHWRSLVSCR